MKRRIALEIVLTLLLINTLTLAFNFQTVEASETIYIRADGSVDPPTANITSADNVIYIFTDNIYDSIVVERDNIVIDGTGYTLEGTGMGTGIDLTERNNVTIKNMEIEAFDYGIWLEDSSSNSVYGNNITTNQYDYASIWLDNSLNNNIYGNNMTYNHACIKLEYSSSNSIYGNHMTNNVACIGLRHSSNNNISRNNMTNNMIGTKLYFSSDNNIYENDVKNNYYGIWLQASSNDNNIFRNNITENDNDISLEVSSNNFIHHNNIVDNNVQVYSYYSTNVWDDDYPSGGNYWSDHIGTDNFTGPHQNVTGSDGIVDTPYVIDVDNQDNYPLMNPWTPLVGDVDGDKDVDRYDYGIFAGAYGTSVGQPRYHVRCDLDQDGDIDRYDFGIFAANYGKTA